MGISKNIKEIIISGKRSWDGELLPAYPEGQPEIIIVRIVVEPGEKLPKHYHPVINAGVVLKGTLTVIAESGLEKEFKAGDGIIEMVGPVHNGENRGEEPVEIIMFYVATPGQPLTLPPAE